MIQLLKPAVAFPSETIPLALSFATFMDKMAAWVNQKSSSGPVQSEELAHYTELNFTRMKRLLKTTALTEVAQEAVNALKQPFRFVVFTESWCGDAAQIIPVWETMTAQNPLIKTFYLLRDEHPELMNHFLTHGGKSIPVIAALNQNGKAWIKWGPRTESAQALFNALKNEGQTKEDIILALQHWYNDDKTIQIQASLAEYLNVVQQGSTD